MNDRGKMSGNPEMPSNGFDPLAQYARLSERVENQGKDIVDLRSNMNTGFQSVNASLNTLSNELRNNSKTPWPVIWSAAGVSFTVLAALGAFFYGTLTREQSRLDVALVKQAEIAQSSVSKLSEATQVAIANMITRQEMDWRQARGAEDRLRMEAGIKEVREAQVPRAELIRTWQNYDQRFMDQQRQIDEVKQAQASVYGARDVLLDLRERVDRMERQRLSSAP